MTRNLMQRVVLLGALVLGALPANAAIDCYGKIQRVLLYSDGMVLIVGTWRNDYTAVCSVQGTWNAISSETCLGWYAAAMKAQAAASNVMLYYNTTTYTCANLPTYAASIVPTYIGLKE